MFVNDVFRMEKRGKELFRESPIDKGGREGYNE